MSKTLMIEIDSEINESYEIVIEKDFDRLSELILKKFSFCNKLMLVFDSNTEKYFKETILKKLENLGKQIYSFTFTAGENSKNPDTVQKLYEELIINNFERKDAIIAVGGGVAGDLAGFTAATYLRGIKFAQVPTTLLAMSDSSVGGKTGVDFMSYKNMVGAFYQPKFVYMNICTLNSLQEREYLSGMAEVIKYGYIRDKFFLDYLINNVDKIMAKDGAALEYTIYHSCRIKKEVIEQDPKEEGLRAILNFGHTIGHAVEKLMKFNLLHGECVALGMVSAGRIAVIRGLMSESELEKMKEMLVNYRLFNKIFLSDIDFGINDVLVATKSDKKMQGGKIKFILTAEIGKAEIYKDVTDEEILEGIKEIFEG